MKLMTKAIEKALPALYATDDTPLTEKTVVAKFFTPWSNWTWFVFEGSQTEDGNWTFFGMVHGMEQEMGYFTLSELESAKGPGGLGVERDIHFSPKPYAECQEG